MEPVCLFRRGPLVRPRCLPCPLLLSPPARCLLPRVLSLLGPTSVIHPPPCAGVGYSGQGLIASWTLSFLAVVAILVLQPLKLFAAPRRRPLIGTAVARRRRQHILTMIATLPLRRRWSIPVTDGRRRDQSIRQLLQRAPARLRQNESASHGLAWMFSCNG